MKYIKATTTKSLVTDAELDEPETIYFSRVLDGVVQNEQFGPGPGGGLYEEMAKEIDAGTAEIEIIDITPVKSWKDKRIEGYGLIRDQLDMQYHDAVDGTTTWKDHVKSVKDANPKE